MVQKAFDYIIVGGGTAGCLIAARLAEAVQPGSVLLVEAGKDATAAEPDVFIPGKYVVQLDSKDINWNFETVAQKELNRRKLPYPRGRGLGGSS